MRALLLTFSFLVALVLPISAQTVVTAESKLEKVVCFLNGAQHFRKATINLVAGRNEIEIKGLSPYINESSISVTVPKPHTLMAMNYRQDFLSLQQNEKKVEALHNSLDSTRTAMERIKNSIDVAIMQDNILQKNQVVGGTASGLSSIELAKVMEFQKQQMTEIRESLIGLRQLQQKKAADTLALYKQIRSLISEQDKQTSIITLVIQSPTGGSQVIDFSYFTDGASWFPSYELRANDLTKPLDLTYRAHISQQTGEAWTNVKLTLSTGEPIKGNEEPQMVPWRLSLTPTYNTAPQARANAQGTRISGYGNPINLASGGQVQFELKDENGESLPGATIQVEGSTIGAITDFDGKATLILPPNKQVVRVSFVGYQNASFVVNYSNMSVGLSASSVQLEEVVVAMGRQTGSISLKGSRSKAKAAYYVDGIRSDKNVVDQSQAESATGFTFEIEKPYTVPSDGKSYTADIKLLNLPAAFSHSCTPRLDKDVFLKASITDWEQYQLLDGMANVYFEDTYVGQTLFSLQADEDTLVLSLGRDKNVLVERTLQKDFSRRAVLSGNKYTSRSWEYTVRNTRQVPITLSLKDQYPISTDKRIEVEQVGHSGANFDPETGFLTWKINLAPASTEKRQMAYKVKYPKGVRFSLD